MQQTWSQRAVHSTGACSPVSWLAGKNVLEGGQRQQRQDARSTFHVPEGCELQVLHACVLRG